MPAPPSLLPLLSERRASGERGRDRSIGGIWTLSARVSILLDALRVDEGVEAANEGYDCVSE